MTSYPDGIEGRRQRPRTSSRPGAAFLGTLIGGLISRSPAGATAGGVLGAAVGGESPVELEQALQEALAVHDCELVELYPRGPFFLKILFRFGNQYWTIESQAPRHPSWTQETLDDWLFGDLIDVQLPRALQDISRSS